MQNNQSNYYHVPQKLMLVRDQSKPSDPEYPSFHSNSSWNITKILDEVIMG